MEHLDFQFTGGAPAGRRAYAGVVGSGDLEVLLTPGNAGQIDVAITTSVNGMSATWQAQLARVFGSHTWPAAKIIINDFGATPAVVRLRLEQALEALNALAQS
ncbi:MAG: malonate decarboxylase subunit delta [Pseudomonadota bacterium]|uniref:Malonate decarboxylase acyl carrier protein n=1 Tax=Ralstonia pickettii TaxID=329 RepID=A0A7X2L8Y3_RALPI|nr:malonate decarboxylase subunit delta [Ralstonia pickettii]MEE2978002.1 malonate decarboxylase subunit delta [Pseudomonadota bacterium]MRS97280.1 malonate decarboxylase subunit delta [Ralstonia pickettii]OCS44998.1 malonate decarboxylase acyl carrier protein [Ralstonia pickettii]WKZ87724.1 malonate decarboxylase subunit delta [Ralstonia pickettii]